MKLLKVLLAALVALSLAACSMDKKPAEEAIKGAVAAVDGVRAEGSQYAAEQFKQLEDSLRAAQDSFAKGEYKTALDSAGGIAAKAQEVATAAAAKKDELTKAWEALNAEIPQRMDAVKAQLDSLMQAKKLPAGLDKDVLAGLQTGFDEASKSFEEAKAAAAGGELQKAVDACTAIKAKAGDLAAALGLPAAQ